MNEFEMIESDALISVNSSSESNSLWEDYYYQKAWIRTNPKDVTLWPGYIYNPADLPPHITPSLKNRAMSLQNKKYIVKYFGMQENSSYGFIPQKDLVLYKDEKDSQFNQKQGKRYSKQYQIGLRLMKQSYDREILDDSKQSFDATDENSNGPNDIVDESIDDTSTSASSDNASSVLVKSKKRKRKSLPPERSRKSEPTETKKSRKNDDKLLVSDNDNYEDSIDDDDDDDDSESEAYETLKPQKQKTKLSRLKKSSSQSEIQSKKTTTTTTSSSKLNDVSLGKGKVIAVEDDCEDRETEISRHKEFLTSIVGVIHVTAADLKRTQETIEKINKLNLNLDEITTLFGTLFSQLRNHKDNAITTLAKQQIKKWKNEHSDAIAKAKETEKAARSATATAINDETNMSTVTATTITAGSSNVDRISSSTAMTADVKDEQINEEEKLYAKLTSSINNVKSVTAAVAVTVAPTASAEVTIVPTGAPAMPIVLNVKDVKSITRATPMISKYDPSMLPKDVFNDLVRRRAVHLLMSVSIHDLTLAVQIENLIYSKMIESDQDNKMSITEPGSPFLLTNTPTSVKETGIDINDSLNKKASTLTAVRLVMDLPKPGRYTSTVNRIAFSMNEPEMSEFRDRVINTGIVNEKDLVSIINITELQKLFTYCLGIISTKSN